MDRPRIVRLAAAAIAISLAGPIARAEPYIPADDTAVLERLPLPADPRLREVRTLAKELAGQPGDLKLALEVARRYLALGQAEGDPRYLGLAQGVLGPWWSVPEPPPGVRLVRAAVKQARHDFAGARADLDALLAANPSSAQALLNRAALLETLGDFKGAERACAKVVRLLRGLAGTACLASASSLGGAARAGYAELSTALETTAPKDDGVRLWALTILGEIAVRLGELAAAERHFQDALALGRRDIYLLMTYADLLLDQGRDAEVVQLLAGETSVDTLLLRRALALRRTGDPAAEELRRMLAARFQAVRLRGDIPHRREEARFALQLEDDAPKALQLARENWQEQRGPADARILLEAALAVPELGAARPVLDWLATTGIEDVALTRLAERFDGSGS